MVNDPCRTTCTLKIIKKIVTDVNVTVGLLANELKAGKDTVYSSIEYQQPASWFLLLNNNTSSIYKYTVVCEVLVKKKCV